jgi:malate permease and related proteins
MLEIMINSIAPIFLVVGVAFLYGRQFKPEPRTLSGVVLYVFIPFLVLRGVAQTEVSGGEVLAIAGVALGVAVLMAVIGLGIGYIFNLETRLTSALVLALILVNAANYGIPLNSFAFGETPDLALMAEQRALIYYVVSVMISNTMGIYFASRGSVSTREALLNIVKVPLIYAAIIGFIFNVTDFTLPLPLERSVGLLADAAIPGMLALLGIQLSRATIRGQIPLILLTSGVRLVVGPVVAVGLALLFGLSGLSFNVAIVQSSMPTAVIAGVLATEFGADSEFVTSVIVVSTLLSVLTLSILLSLLI